MSFRHQDLIHLDAEDLAGQGILRTYDRLKPNIRELGGKPAEVEEEVGEDGCTYTVIWGDRRFDVYSPPLKADGWDAWGRATYAFFKLVNLQMRGKPYLLYAVNGGNDLAGIFLTSAAAAKYRKSWSRPQDWPYLPKLESPWYGQSH